MHASPEQALPRPESRLLAGVDEAGLGPILGPLVVAGVAMSGPEGGDPWQLLQSMVCRDRREAHKFRVADSKKVHQGKYGLRHLEHTVLGFWTAMHGDIPKSIGAFLEACGMDMENLQRCPWYQDLDQALPLRNDPAELALQGHNLARCLRQAEMRLLHLAIRPVEVEEFNALIAQTDNKSEAHFIAYAGVISQLLRILPGRAHLVADRCGGRMHYQSCLRRHLDLSLDRPQIRILQESPGSSSYQIGETETGVRITFTARGEDRSFPTALASCTAKYVRELLLDRLNCWFQGQIPGLKRTAGYYVDGHRFLLDVAELVEAPDFPRGRLLRVR